ncbi:MAG: nucleoside 2-deoxyribosyltransferase domain-containing protein [Herpetosiphonaceae bacterium]|nr:nucleoside 2-deoxyribosyltransferase domain-containing protein [Herpetosiphonaceae bacterium]
MAIILNPPAPLPASFTAPTLFLAGSIEMGRASNWQQEVEASFAHSAITILNPRRDDWDASWRQELANRQFRAQVEWELAAQERADLIVMYFAPETQAPITLLELGLFARSGRLVVCCPAGYWRKGNVDVVCARYGIPQVPTLAELCAEAARRLGAA